MSPCQPRAQCSSLVCPYLVPITNSLHLSVCPSTSPRMCQPQTMSSGGKLRPPSLEATPVLLLTTVPQPHPPPATGRQHQGPQNLVDYCTLSHSSNQSYMTPLLSLPQFIFHLGLLSRTVTASHINRGSFSLTENMAGPSFPGEHHDIVRVPTNWPLGLS